MKRADTQWDSPFDKPELEADLEHWGKMPFWTLVEANALAFGKDPKRLSVYNLSVWPDSRFAAEYIKLEERIRRAQIDERLADPIAPKAFLRWGQEQSLAMPAELIQTVIEIDARAHASETGESVIGTQAEGLTRSGGTSTKFGAGDPSLDQSKYWREFAEKLTGIVEGYPEWKSSVVKVYKSANLTDWLEREHQLDSRETQIAIRVLKDFFDELN